jgi:hypothetical protein
MRSADAAVAAARAAGLRVQAIVALDAPTEATRRYFEQPRFDHWERRRLAEGDPGLVRNVVAGEADGRFITFIDGHDLVSENWLVEGAKAFHEAEDRGVRAIAHPELNVAFDAARSVVVNVPQSSPLFTTHRLYAAGYYGASCLAPREAHVEVPYAPHDLDGGSGQAGDRFTIETLDAGWEHIVVTDTIIFNRIRDESAVTGRHVRPPVLPLLPAMAIDRVREVGAAGRRRAR